MTKKAFAKCSCKIILSESDGKLLRVAKQSAAEGGERTL